MYKRANEYDQEDDEANGTDAALIDSYFLPGGILDPEESSSHNLNRPHHGTEATNGHKKDSENETSGVCIAPSSRVMQSKLSSASTSLSSGAATEGRVFGMSLKFNEAQGQRNVEEEECLLRHHERLPIQNSRQHDNFLNNDLLRSQLEQLTVGSRSLDYQSHVIQRPNSLPIGSGNHREGVSALDPLADSVVGEVGGRPIMNTSVSQTHPTSSLGLPSPFAIDSTKSGIQRVTPAAGTGASATASTDPVVASASTCSTAAFGNFSSDWFSSRPTSTANNIPQVGVVQAQEDFSNFLRLALPNRDGDLNAFGSSSSVASDTKSHSSFLQRHGENLHGSVMSNHAIKTNPWNVQDDNYETLANIISDSQSSSHRPSHITRDAHNATTSLLATKASAAKSSLPPVNNSSYFVPTGDHRVSPPPGFLSSSSPSQPVTSTVQGKSSIRETFHQDDDAARIVAGTLRDGTLSGRVSKSAQELRSMPFTSDHHRQPDAFDECPGVLHTSNVVQSPFRRHVEDEQQRHHHHRRNQQPQGVQSSTKNQQQKVKTPSRHHNDGDYDLSSLNTKMSRDVPSTIYVEEDTLSISEDTLTVCADSMTEASLPNRSHGKVVEYDRNGMDAVQETDAVEVSRDVYIYIACLVFSVIQSQLLSILSIFNDGESRHSGKGTQCVTRDVEMLAFCQVFYFSLSICLISACEVVAHFLAVLKAVSIDFVMLQIWNAHMCFFRWNHTSHNGDKFNNVFGCLFCLCLLGNTNVFGCFLESRNVTNQNETGRKGPRRNTRYKSPSCLKIHHLIPTKPKMVTM